MPFTEGKQVVPYSSIRDQLNTGDIILFSTVGSSGFVIKLGSNSQFSHAGLVIIEIIILYRDSHHDHYPFERDDVISDIKTHRCSKIKL